MDTVKKETNCDVVNIATTMSTYFGPYGRCMRKRSDPLDKIKQRREQLERDSQSYRVNLDDLTLH